MSENDTVTGSSNATTRSLLRWGVMAGPFYLGLGVGQALLREGFDFARHPLSVLANGPYGWLQTANFLLTGAMVVATAVGIRHALAPNAGATPWLLGAYGVAMIAAAVFTADPVDAFPPGTPEGLPTSISTTGLLHFVFGALGFLCLSLSAFAAARAMHTRGAAMLARVSLASGLIVFIGFFGGIVFPLGIAGIWIAVAAGWIWLAVLASRL